MCPLIFFSLILSSNYFSLPLFLLFFYLSSSFLLLFLIFFSSDFSRINFLLFLFFLFFYCFSLFLYLLLISFHFILFYFILFFFFFLSAIFLCLWMWVKCLCRSPLKYAIVSILQKWRATFYGIICWVI